MAQVQSLTGEFPHAEGVAKKTKKKNIIWKQDKVGGWGRAGGSFIFLCFILFGSYSISQSSQDELEPSVHLVLLQFSGIKMASE